MHNACMHPSIHPSDLVNSLTRFIYLQLTSSPDCIFLTVTDVFNSLQDWRNVQVLIGKTGKESLKRRVSDFDVEKLGMNVALKVKEMLTNYQLNEIRDTSAGAATFYVWVSSIVD